MESDPQSHTRDGLLCPNSIMVSCIDPLAQVGTAGGRRALVGRPRPIVNPIKLETGLRPNSAGIPLEATGFPTFGLLL